MSLVNCCVVNKTTNWTIFSWSILATGESRVMMQQFFEDNIVTWLHVTDKFELDSAYLGKLKDTLDQIDLSLTLDAALHFLVHSYVTTPIVLNKYSHLFIMHLQFLCQIRCLEMMVIISLSRICWYKKQRNSSTLSPESTKVKKKLPFTASVQHVKKNLYNASV